MPIVRATASEYLLTGRGGVIAEFVRRSTAGPGAAPGRGSGPPA